jgi:predicted nucleic acid-binding protein
MADVLADSSVLIEFFRPNGNEDVRGEVSLLLDGGHLAVCGIVVSELLQGVRSDEKGPLKDLLDEAHYLEFSRFDFESAGEACNSLRRKGQKIPITDALIASLCIRLKMPLYTLDSHFNHFRGLTLHKQ